MKPRSELFNKLYKELRRLAVQRLGREAGGRGDATSLVHEAYLKLRIWGNDFQDDKHFLATISKVIRQILVDRARRAACRNGLHEEISVSLDNARCESGVIDVLTLDELMNRLARFDSRAAQVTEMHVFLELTEREIAEALGISPRTVKRDWAIAKAWLKAELAQASP
ncbi:MAG TPA: ECF-type sigma factor [Bryobacteraceae bacterium]|nr:ECF-type sigma factor [Bryobacteraceae bacterium]